ncbi:unnamed protein product [Mytilus coruscus]|uniref:Uncharacterized protein n=1 Tax=Mytilus coruscus TaxID=42192 RepID=A0A6J8ELI9_MYTCO|nr:unnamed protein product [Mytilus coruscus]
MTDDEHDITGYEHDITGDEHNITDDEHNITCDEHDITGDVHHDTGVIYNENQDTESPISLRHQMEVMRKKKHCVPHSNNIERGETLPREIQFIIINLCLRQNLSSRYVLIRVNSFFRQVVQTVPVPRLYIGISVLLNVPNPVNVRRILRASGCGSDLILSIREIIRDPSWINAWLFLIQRDNRWFEIKNIWWSRRK